MKVIIVSNRLPLKMVAKLNQEKIYLNHYVSLRATALDSRLLT